MDSPTDLTLDPTDDLILEELVVGFLIWKTRAFPSYNLTDEDRTRLASVIHRVKVSQVHAGIWLDYALDGENQHKFRIAEIKSGRIKAKVARRLEDAQHDDFMRMVEVNRMYVHNYILSGHTLKCALLADTLPLDPWYRILASVDKDQELIDKYGEAAKTALTPALLDFLLTHNLPIERILPPWARTS